MNIGVKHFGGPGLGAALALLLALGLQARTAGADPADRRLGAPFGLRERPTLGSATAPVVVLEISSFSCAHCRRFHQEVFPRLRDRYVATGRVQWVMVNASLDPSEATGALFAAGRCALRSGRYWALLDDLLAVGASGASTAAAAEAAVPADQRPGLRACLCDPATARAVALDFGEVASLGLDSTPTFILRRLGPHGECTQTRIVGEQSLDYFQRVLDKLLGQGGGQSP